MNQTGDFGVDEYAFLQIVSRLPIELERIFACFDQPDHDPGELVWHPDAIADFHSNSIVIVHRRFRFPHA